MTRVAAARARLYDRLLAPSEGAGLAERRAQLLKAAHGRVLEIGAGTGLNLVHYPPSIELTLTEPDAAMRARLRDRFEIVDAPAEELPFADQSFDTVVSTLVLCSVDDPTRALAEIRRVLKPAGLLLLIEHVRSDRANVAQLHDLFDRPWRALSGGCRCNRATADRLTHAGFDTATLNHGRLPKAPFLLRPLIHGAVYNSGSVSSS